MAALRLLACLGATLALACATAPPRQVTGIPAPGTAGGPPPVLPSAPDLARTLPGTPPVPGPEAAFPPGAWGGAAAVPSGLDLARWPVGWVDDPAGGERLGRAQKFWSNRRLDWLEVLGGGLAVPVQVRRLTALYQTSAEAEERVRAAWRLALLHRQAGLAEGARLWFDRASEAAGGLGSADLARAWDQLTRLNDPQGARALVPLAGPWTPDEARQRDLLRQKLYLGTLDLGILGADNAVSTILLDRDDLWAGTWNGAVVRWSVPTGTLDLIQPLGKAVAPVRRLTATGWFLYAFQDQQVLRYSKVSGTWRAFDYPPGWTGLRVQGAWAEGDEVVWVAYLGAGLWKFDRGRWTLVDGGGGGPFLNALAPDGAGGFWIGTKDRGLWHWTAGLWSAVGADGRAPADISVIEADPAGGRWAVGTWGEGRWVLEGGRLRPLGDGGDYVTAAAWTARGPLWGLLDRGLVEDGPGGPRNLGPAEGLPPGGVSGLALWAGRWIWGTNGQGLGWWSEDEDPALLR